MKKRILFILFMLLSFIGNTYGQSFNPNLSTNRNYVLTITPQVESTNADGLAAHQALRTVQYFDGLGRPVQTAQIQASPNKANLVTYQEYDANGRTANAWIPVVATSNNGSFVSLGNVMSKSLSTYRNDAKAHTKTAYELSPLNRVIEQYGPGQDWQNNEKKVQTAYLTNNTTYPCKLYQTTDNLATVSISRVSNTTNYTANQLYVTRQMDEDGNISYEFKDKLGHVVLTRQMDGTDAHDTYYIYDSYDNLRAVLPPLAADNLSAGTWNDSTTYLQQYAYLYKYDDYKRCIAKKLPGAEWIYYIYDKTDRLIFTQDGEQYPHGEWTFSIPDDLGRTVLTGTCKNTFNYQNNPLENIVMKATWAGTSGAYKGYNISGMPPASPVKILSAQYYDSYDFMTLSGFSALEYITPESIFGTRYTESYKSLLTGTYFAEAGNGSEQICSALYYDYRGRLVQSQATNHLAGKDSEFIGYNFGGQPEKRKAVHTALGATQTQLYTYIYDHAGRLEKVTYKLNSNTPVTLAEYAYDNLGRMQNKKVHTTGSVNALSYAYNVRSWLTGIVGTNYTQYLYYNTGDGAPRYNGNISSMTWRTTTDNAQRYKFTYDKLNRMTDAIYGRGIYFNEIVDYPNEYNNTVSYDKHGNITRQIRGGDDLSINHTGNQITTAGNSSFSYNRNGSMTKDTGKGIMTIEYNSLNLPKKVIWSSSKYTEYLYDASGRKLQTKHVNGATTLTTDYCGSVIYENRALKRILNEEGYVTLSGTTPSYYYYLKDHLGNNRVVAQSTGTPEQKSSYYPFGSTFKTSGENAQPYKFGGKELDGNTQWHDFEARNYDDRLSRFTTMDAMAEKYYAISPYAYCANNPMRYVDPTGMVLTSPDDIMVNTENKAIDVFKTQDAYDRIFIDRTDPIITEKGFLDLQAAESRGYKVRHLKGAGFDITDTGLALLGGELAFAKLGGWLGQTFGKIFSSGKNSTIVTKMLTNSIEIENAVWAQKTFNHAFSGSGNFAGETISSLAKSLMNGTRTVADVPIDVVVRNGQTFILNTRSSVALMEAGVARSSWNVVNRTGQEMFEKMLSDQLTRNGLINGTNIIKQSKASILYMGK
ncbi:DUF6443 domain-containing protein [Bacteroides sp. 51]|uniref:DUF6443 domain-containing protein n=1 Tax=Bacteroides sp. 51 TaxID=2302938 RepID=UPI0013D010DB|nr:DUF6443 domain-containing protein [Bacteroides sp. 51]